MNILLIHPYIISSAARLYLNEPIGLVCLATYLEANAKSKRNINTLDLYALGYENIKKFGNYYKIGISDEETIVKMIKRYDPDVIGITCNFTTYAKATFELANLIKTNFQETLLILGGAHATMDAENILNKQCQADMVVRGEGEITLNEIIERIEKGKDFHDVVGITYRKNGKTISNPKRPLMPDINILPIPDRKYILQNLYSEINNKMYFLSKNNRIASIMTSRGCPYNCTFCSTKVVWERKFRPRRAELVIEEMELLIKNYNIKEFLINDDQFYLDKKRVNKICDMIIDKQFDITLNVASGSSVWLLDENLLRKLKKAGLYRITFPIETGSKNTMKYIKKPINLDNTKDLIRLANSLGIWTYANFILGFPYEKYSDIQETINYARKSGLDYATFFIAKPYAGSEMHEDFKKEGLLKDDIVYPTHMGEVGHNIVHISANDLQSFRNRAQKRYFLVVLFNYLNPLFFYKYVFPKIDSYDGLRYFMNNFKNSIIYFLFNQRLIPKIERSKS